MGDSCDITVISASDGGTSQWLEAYKADWEAVARYSIICHYSEVTDETICFRKKVVATGVTWQDGKGRCPALDAEACRIAGVPPDSFGRPIHTLKLEHSDATFAAFQARRRSQNPPCDRRP